MKNLAEWILLGALLAEANGARFDRVIDAVRRIAEAEQTLAEDPDDELRGAVLAEISGRFKN